MKNIFTFLIAVLIGSASYRIDSFAYADNRTVTFDQVLADALEQSPTMKQIAQTRAAYRAQQKELSLFDNPQLSAEIRPYTAHPSGLDLEHEVSIAQPLRLSNFGARQHVARLIAETADIDTKLLLVQFEQELLLSYGRVWALQERAQFLSKLMKRADGLLAKVSTANTGGLLPVSTKQLILAEQKRLRVERSAILAEQDKALAVLIKKAGSNLSHTSVAAIALTALPSDIVMDDAIPLVQRVNAKSHLAIEQHRLARLDAFPQFTPRIAFDHTADGDDRILVGLTFPLPLFDRNQPEKIQAQAEEATQQAMKKYVDDGVLQHEVRLLTSSARSSMAQAQALHTDVLPTLESAYTAAEREVFAGQGSPLQLWQVLTEMRDLQQRYLELWTQALSYRTELSMLTGKSF
jgi:cobalt-zinc-cadmium efflux system outer membrane protein